MVILVATDMVSISIFHYANRVLNEIKTGTSHNSCVSHVPYIYLCYFKVTVLIFLQIKREDSVSRNIQLMLKILYTFVAELIYPVLIQKSSKVGIACYM